MYKEPIKITFIGHNSENELSYLKAEIKEVYPNHIEFRYCKNQNFSLSMIPLYCNSDLLVFNWDKFAFIIALFLRKFPSFPVKLVLYSGVICHGKLNFEKIMNLGIFDYFISKENPLWTQHNWKIIFKELSQKPPRRDEISCDNAIGYLLYRWRFHRFGPASHIQISLGDNYWSEEPKVYCQAFYMFQEHFKNEIRRESLEMDVKPFFGVPNFRPDTKTKCFIMMPLKEPFTTIFSDHIKPVLEELQIEIDRADDYYTTHEIMKDIWNGINNCHFAIAELTGRNSNVMYELGMAHTIGKSVVLISQNNEDVPFDLRHLRCYRYEYTPRGCKKLSKDIKNVCLEILGKTPAEIID